MLEGRLVRLRVSEPEDAPDLLRFFTDPDVLRHLGTRYPVSLRAEEEWIASVGRPDFENLRNLAIVARADGRLLGGCGFHVTEPENRSAELGIAIGDKTAWNQGYGTDAMRLLCRFGFDEMNLHRIRLWVHADNPRAIHVYERLGFVVEARGREMTFRAGAWRDELLMGLLRAEFRDDDPEPGG